MPFYVDNCPLPFTKVISSLFFAQTSIFVSYRARGVAIRYTVFDIYRYFSLEETVYGPEKKLKWIYHFESGIYTTFR